MKIWGREFEIKCNKISMKHFQATFEYFLSKCSHFTLLPTPFIITPGKTPSSALNSGPFLHREEKQP